MGSWSWCTTSANWVPGFTFLVCVLNLSLILENVFLRKKNIQCITYCFMKKSLAVEECETPLQKSYYNFMSYQNQAVIFQSSIKKTGKPNELSVRNWTDGCLIMNCFWNLICATFVYLQHIIMHNFQKIFHVNQWRYIVILFWTQNCGKMAHIPVERTF